MDALPPLLVGCPPPSRGLPLQQAVDGDERHSGNSMAMDWRAIDSHGQYNGNLTAIDELTAMDDDGWGSTSDGWCGAKAMDDATST